MRWDHRNYCEKKVKKDSAYTWCQKRILPRFWYKKGQRYPFYIVNKGCESERVQFVSDVEHIKLWWEIFLHYVHQKLNIKL